jgi:D-tyrosyl-tRNA(Tyr) deacylase
LVFAAFGAGDDDAELDWMARKLPTLRIFSDEAGLMNRNLEGVDGGLLVISQFTLYGDLRKGTRPSFSHAAAPDAARELYERFLAKLEAAAARKVERGIFAADMQIEAHNDGPVTLILHSPMERKES